MKALMKIVDGLKLLNNHAQLRLSSDGEFLVVEEREFKIFRPVTTATYKIPLKNIITTTTLNESELVEENKSPIARGIVGGLVFGPAGLVLGGLSGIGKKKNVKQQQLFIVSFVSSEDEIKNVTFVTDSVSNASVTKRFNKYMLKEIQRVTPSEKVQKYRNDLENEMLSNETIL